MNTDLLKGSAVQVYFETASSIATTCAVKLAFELNKRYYEIIRFDTEHGCPHKDVLNAEGKVIRKFGMIFWIISRHLMWQLHICTGKNNYQ